MEKLIAKSSVQENDIVAFEYMDVVNGNACRRRGVAVVKDAKWFKVASNVYKEENRIWYDDNFPEHVIFLEPTINERLLGDFMHKDWMRYAAYLSNRKKQDNPDMYSTETYDSIYPLLDYLDGKVVDYNFPIINSNLDYNEIVARYYIAYAITKGQRNSLIFKMSDEFSKQMMAESQKNINDNYALNHMFPDNKPTMIVVGKETYIFVCRMCEKIYVSLFKGRTMTFSHFFKYKDTFEDMITFNVMNLLYTDSTINSIVDMDSIYKNTIVVLYSFLAFMKDKTADVITDFKKSYKMEYGNEFNFEKKCPIITLDKKYYTAIDVDKDIHVSSYRQRKTIRNKITGELEKVWVEVSGYVKHGYHRDAVCENNRYLTK